MPLSGNEDEKTDWLCRHKMVEEPIIEAFPANKTAAQYVSGVALAFLDAKAKRDTSGAFGGLAQAMMASMSYPQVTISLEIEIKGTEIL